MASRSVRKIGWFVAGDIALVLALFVFGLALDGLKIPIDAHPFLMRMLGPHGLIANILLPLAIYSLGPAIAIWIIAWVVTTSKKTK